MGTGKSVLAKAITPLLGAEVIRTDVLRKELMQIDPEERHPEKFGEGIYADSVSRRTYEEALRRADRMLSRDVSVLIDASFRRRGDRLMAMQTAAAAGADFFVLECVCPEEVARMRLEERSSTGTEASDGRWELYSAQRREFEPIDEIPAGAHVIVDTAAPPETCAAAAIERIRLGGG
jgi:predicted kinase